LEKEVLINRGYTFLSRYDWIVDCWPSAAPPVDSACVGPVCTEGTSAGEVGAPDLADVRVAFAVSAAKRRAFSACFFRFMYRFRRFRFSIGLYCFDIPPFKLQAVQKSKQICLCARRLSINI
jgi:hypothetical protein